MKYWQAKLEPPGRDKTYQWAETLPELLAKLSDPTRDKHSSSIQYGGHKLIITHEELE